MPKYIDADALLAEAKRISGPMTGDGWSNWGVYALIERQPAADVDPKRKWISVTKSLPKQSGVYRVCGHRRGSPMESWECEFWILPTINVGGWLNRAERPYVEYWLPKSEVPEPPKGEDDA